MKPLDQILFAALALLALPGCSRAESLVAMQVRDLETQGVLTTYPHRGRDYIQGQPGHRYAIELQNLTGQRVLTVVSVDGVNAISGETAGSRQSGYVLGPWQRLEIRGWRKSLSDVAEFHFTGLDNSYAARTGRPQNVGVIGVAAFRELAPPVPMYRDDIYPSAPLGKSSAAPAAMPEPAQEARADSGARAERQADSSLGMAQQLGTGHGDRRYDPANTTTFERESARPNQIVSLYYDSTEALLARGILPRPLPDWQAPEAFPIGFTPDP